MKVRLVCLLLVGLLFVRPCVAHAGLYQWSIPRGEDGKGRVYLWIPENCARVRGLVLDMRGACEERIVETPAVREACRRARVGIAVIAGSGTPFGADWGWPSGMTKAEDKEYSRLKQVVRDPASTAQEVAEAKAKLYPIDKDLTARAGTGFQSVLGDLAKESGYEEIARAPVLTIGHSMSGLLC